MIESSRGKVIGWYTDDIMTLLKYPDVIVKNNLSLELDDAWHYCILNSLVRKIDESFFESILIDKATKLSDKEFSKNIIRYIEVAFGYHSSSDAVDQLYRYLDGKMKTLIIYPDFGSSEVSDKDVEEIFDKDVEEYYRFISYKEKYGKKIACDYVMSRLHDLFTKPTIDYEEDSCYQFRHLFDLNGQDVNLIINILNTLSDDGVWNYIVDSQGLRHKDEEKNKWILERNSEHRRKILKQTKRRKIHDIKKHTIRKRVTGG